MNAPLSSHDRMAASRVAARDVRLRSLVTRVPGHVLEQKRVQETARAYYTQRTGLFDHLEPVFSNARIDTRYACQPFEWYLNERDFGEKSRLYAEHATGLCLDAAKGALEAAGLTAPEIDAIVVVSTTGVVTPSLDARLMNLLPFRRDTIRLPIFGFGCAGGVLGLTRAAQLARSQPGMRCLLIVVELCTMAVRHDRASPSNIVATALFGDGAAAAVVEFAGPDEADSASPALATIGIGGEHCWADTLDIMGWHVDAGGLDVIFSNSIPEVIAADYPAALDGFLARSGLTRSDFVRPCCHPGGVKVLDALEVVYGLAPGALDAEWEILSEYGNMSAPTVLFVLDRLIAKGQAGTVLMSSLGPGFTAAFQFVDLDPQAMTLGWPHLLIALVAIERVVELAHARRNARALLAAGGRETGAGHYPLFIALHGCWMVALAVLAKPDLPPDWALIATFALLQLMRLWVILSLGPYWTTRVITVAGAPSVRTGPYRFLRHPNYAVVALEIPVVSLAVGLPWVALLFGCLNALLLLYRIRVEDAARAEAALNRPIR